MTLPKVPAGPFTLLRPPYDVLAPVALKDLSSTSIRGVALIWDLVGGIDPVALRAASNRPPGMALMVMLPPPETVRSDVPIFEIVESCRPHSILPHHPRHCVDEWSSLLRRLPPDLPSEVVDHLIWSGTRIDQNTRHLVRRILELSAELRTVSALARSLYISRRALGRRMLQRSLPVPSHWLHFGRIIRVALKLQASPANLFSVASSLGYPDGFALSNQMYRLTGVRPSEAREALGWEWLVEAWMARERAGLTSVDDSVSEPQTGAVTTSGAYHDVDQTLSTGPS